jgi:hypothetical protein
VLRTMMSRAVRAIIEETSACRTPAPHMEVKPGRRRVLERRGRRRRVRLPHLRAAVRFCLMIRWRGWAFTAVPCPWGRHHPGAPRATFRQEARCAARMLPDRHRLRRDLPSQGGRRRQDRGIRLPRMQVAQRSLRAPSPPAFFIPTNPLRFGIRVHSGFRLLRAQRSRRSGSRTHQARPRVMSSRLRRKCQPGPTRRKHPDRRHLRFLRGALSRVRTKQRRFRHLMALRRLRRSTIRRQRSLTNGAGRLLHRRSRRSIWASKRFLAPGRQIPELPGTRPAASPRRLLSHRQGVHG